jgi:FKBP-type peptidyl-prolyl cis-trans isomerase FklB
MIRRLSLFVWAVAVLPLGMAQSQDTTLPAQAAPVKDPVSYTIGLSIGRQLLGDGFMPNDLQGQEFLDGMLDAMDGKKPKIPEEQMRTVAQQIDQILEKRFQERQAKNMQARQAIAEPNLERSQKFLAENAKQPGVVELPSGLQYAVIAKGNGASPQATDTVVVHYTGKTIDGKVFDSSVQRGKPATFAVNRVVKGWTEGLQKMVVGDKWMLFLPPALAYGETGVDALGPDGKPLIGPNEALVFEVELLEIAK